MLSTGCNQRSCISLFAHDPMGVVPIPPMAGLGHHITCAVAASGGRTVVVEPPPHAQCMRLRHHTLEKYFGDTWAVMAPTGPGFAMLIQFVTGGGGIDGASRREAELPRVVAAVHLILSPFVRIDEGRAEIVIEYGCCALCSPGL